MLPIRRCHVHYGPLDGRTGIFRILKVRFERSHVWWGGLDGDNHWHNETLLYLLKVWASQRKSNEGGPERELCQEPLKVRELVILSAAEQKHGGAALSKI